MPKYSKKKYLLLCNTCKISFSNDCPVMCQYCNTLIWCGNCPLYTKNKKMLCSVCNIKFLV